MQRMQRKFGTFLPRTADDAQVGMLIHEFENADKMLETLIDASKLWRDSWADILNRQSAILADYDILYSTLGSDEKGSVASHIQLERVSVLKASYFELKTDMLEEVALVDKRIIEPAKDARLSLKTYKKVIKKREDKKLDYERYKGRVDSVEKKTKKTDRDHNAMAKHNIDLSGATAEYQAADDELRNTLPQMTSAAYSLLPPLLNAQIMIQNTLLGQLYTTLHNYSQDHGFPSPPPEMEEIIAIFESDFTSLRLEVESGIRMLALGKAVHQPMTIGDQGKSYSGMNLRNHANGAIKARRNNSSGPGARQQAIMPPSPSPPLPTPDLSTKPGAGSAAFGPWTRPETRVNPDTTAGAQLTASTPSSVYAQSQHDYFLQKTASNQSAHSSPNTSMMPFRARQPSTTSLHSTVSNTSTNISSIAAGKKKPPPPPPKRILSQQFEYVVALYDFEGQSAGDLSFREGERIKIVKKTTSDQDWWTGELRSGAKGEFPANYCRAA